MTAPLRMLVVDDDPDLRRSLHQQFTDEDFKVETAEDGEAALQMLSACDYDIVLLDLKMPRMDGATLLGEMKKLRKHPRVVILTIVDDLKRAIECTKLGANDYVTKPYDPEELLHVVIKVLSS